LYPTLKVKTEPKIKKLSRKFQNEMEGLEYLIMEYSKKWDPEKSLNSGRKTFINETIKFCMKIREGIAKE